MTPLPFFSLKSLHNCSSAVLFSWVCVCQKVSSIVLPEGDPPVPAFVSPSVFPPLQPNPVKINAAASDDPPSDNKSRLFMLSSCKERNAPSPHDCIMRPSSRDPPE